MIQFKTISFSKKQARRELNEFKDLLNDPAKPKLKQREDILPFFAALEQLISSEKHTILSATIWRW
jgi:hypothetical protein